MTDSILTDEQKAEFERNGYLVVRLFDTDEITALREHFMLIHAAGPVPGFFQPATKEETSDILKQYPRIMHPHRFDETSMKYMLDLRLRAVLRDLLGEEPLAAQSMFYFKPPGARGQAPHQDNFYLKVSPGTCMAAWVAVDDADPANGGMSVVPGSHKLEILCPRTADLKKSFTTEEVDIPEKLNVVPTFLKAGDVLFFNGSLIHGSTPNESSDRFRRAFICHYVGESITAMSNHYYPLHTFDGETLTRDAATGGGPCGTEQEEALAALRKLAGTE
jgi:ectoine hydroxylase-related dioxygenase (phytanoyl-CoA dioxygenase family)